ncbi:MAG: methyltransferase domain-containing protein [Elusimicrobia bacterium]|nr:methyltransferase domain-containing protein [Elusimicrobiota bacterium]
MEAMPGAHLEELDRLSGSYWWHVHRAETVANLAGRFSPPAGFSNYLDIGCGPGAAARAVADRLSSRGKFAGGAEVLGLDGDERLAAACKSHGVKLVVCELGAGALPPLERRFELFTAMDALEHLKEPQRLLAALRPQLTDGALGVISVPAYQWLFSDWDRAAGHQRRYDAASLRDLLEQARFEVVWQSYLYSFALPAAVLRRKTLPAVEAEKALAFPGVPSWLNSALRLAGAAERLWLKAGRIPFGTSLLAAVRPKT